MRSEKAHNLFRYSVSLEGQFTDGVPLMDIYEHLSTLRVLHRAALLIFNNAIIILHYKMERIPEKKRNTHFEKFVLVLVCDYNSSILAHDTHQTSS